MFNKKSKALWAGIALLTVGFVPQAFAAGTTAGTTVTNTASVSYEVNGDPRTAADATADFTVDRIIDMTLVLTTTTPPTGTPSATGLVTAYTLTNVSNDTLDFNLAVQEVSGTAMAGLGTDNQDTAGYAVYVESDGVAGYTAGDTQTSVDNLPADTSATIYVVVDIPAGALDDELIGVSLAATALDSAGNALVKSTSSDANTSGVDTVFDDAAGVLDGVADAVISVYGAYSVNSATLVVAKYSTVISDPINGTTNPKLIPGAVVEYCIVIANSGGSAASDVILTDNIPTNTTYDVADGVATGDEVGSPATDASACLTDETSADLTGTSASTVTANFSTLASDSYAWVSFQVTLN